jgi:hypothetical protein
MVTDPGDAPGGDDERPDASGAIARATVTIDGATVTILPRRAPVGNSGPIRGRSVAVFPVAASDACPANVAPATVEPGTRDGHAVLDLTEAEARARGATLGVSAVLFWDGRRAQILT